MHEEINRAIEDGKWTLDKLVDTFTEKGIPFSEINSIKTLFEKPEIQELNRDKDNSLTTDVVSDNYPK